MFLSNQTVFYTRFFTDRNFRYHLIHLTNEQQRFSPQQHFTPQLQPCTNTVFQKMSEHSENADKITSQKQQVQSSSSVDIHEKSRKVRDNNRKIQENSSLQEHSIYETPESRKPRSQSAISVLPCPQSQKNISKSSHSNSFTDSHRSTFTSSANIQPRANSLSNFNYIDQTPKPVQGDFFWKCLI